MKRVLLGILWCIVIYFAACSLIGAIAGALTGAANPGQAATLGFQAGFDTVSAVRGYILAAAALLATFGVRNGVLPGTR